MDLLFLFLSNESLLLLLVLFRAEGRGPSCELAAARGLWLLSRVPAWLCLSLLLPWGCSEPIVGWGLVEASYRVQVGSVLVREWQRLKSALCPFLRGLEMFRHWSLLQQVIAVPTDVAKLLPNRLLKNFISSNRIHP